MKLPLARGSSDSERTKDEQLQQAVTDAIEDSSDKEIIIRPAKKSGGSRLRRMLLIAGVFGAIALWMRRSEKPTQKIQQTASKAADRTKQMTGQAADTVQEEGQTFSERVEEGSQMAGEQIQEAGEQAAETVDQGSEQAGEQIEEKGEEAADKTEEAAEASSSGSSGS